MKKKPFDYRETERERGIALIKNTNLFNNAKSGHVITYKGKEHLKEEILSDGINNIYKPIQDDVLEYFNKNKIAFWHTPRAKEASKKPTGHILSSQVCCINHLFPIRHDYENVLQIAKTICTDFEKVLPINTDKYLPGYIQFESVSDIDHLNEKKQTQSELTRGSNCTSVDALIYAEHKNGSKYLIPIEWKYTEYYNNQDKSIENRDGEAKEAESKGKERLHRYSDLITDSQYLIGKKTYRNSIYFFEPFYQLMRQTLWAEQMIQHKNNERIKADNYIHIHIIPNENKKLLNKKYKVSQKPLRESWLDNLKDKGKYIIISPWNFIKNIDNNKYGDLLNYLQVRYWNNKNNWICG